MKNLAAKNMLYVAIAVVAIAAGIAAAFFFLSREEYIQRVEVPESAQKLGSYSTERASIDVSVLSEGGDTILFVDGSIQHDTGEARLKVRESGSSMYLTYVKDDRIPSRLTGGRVAGVLFLTDKVQIPDTVNEVYFDKEKVKIWER